MIVNQFIQMLRFVWQDLQQCADISVAIVRGPCAENTFVMKLTWRDALEQMTIIKDAWSEKLKAKESTDDLKTGRKNFFGIKRDSYTRRYSFQSSKLESYGTSASFYCFVSSFSVR